MDVCAELLASTGSDGAAAAIAAAMALGVGLFVVGRRRRVADRQAGTDRTGSVSASALVAVVIAVAVCGAGAAPAAQAAVSAAPAQCAGAGTGGAMAPAPVTPFPSPPAAPTGALSGSLVLEGQQLVITSPPGDYLEAPGIAWNLPTIEPLTGPVPAASVRLLGPGPDTVFGTADDELLGTTTTDASGSYRFAALPDGPYAVSSDPPPSTQTGSYVWSTLPTNGCLYSYVVPAWSWLSPVVGALRLAAVAGGGETVAVDFSAENPIAVSTACV